MEVLAGETEGFVNDLRKADKGLNFLTHGFQSLMASAMMAGGSMDKAGEAAEKSQQKMMKAMSTLAQFHAGVLIVRGLSNVFTVLTGTVVKYTAEVLE